jgi:taurine dioxygenase
METTVPPRILLTPMQGRFGCEVIGADLSRPLPDADFARIRQAWFDHSFLVFRDIDMDPAQQVAFTRRLGPLGGCGVAAGGSAA